MNPTGAPMTGESTGAEGQTMTPEQSAAERVEAELEFSEAQSDPETVVDNEDLHTLLAERTELLARVETARRDALNQAWRAVDACGWGVPSEIYSEAIEAACWAISKLGGRDPNPAIAQMRGALGAIDRALACEEADANAETDMSGDVYAKINVTTLRNTIRAALNGAPNA